MTVDPFIEAEEVAGHSVQNACRLLEVSKSAYYQRRNGAPSARQLSDAELLEKIKGIHAESKGSYGAPRIHKELLHRHVGCGKRKVTRLMRQAGLEGRCKKRWRKTTVPDPDAERRAISSSATSGPALKWTVAMSATSPTSRLGRAGPTWRRSSTWPPDVSSAGLWPITCAPNWSKTLSPWPSPTGHPIRASFFIRTGAVRADSTDRRNASMMEVSCDGRHQTAEGDVADARKTSLSRTATWLATRPATAVLDRDHSGQDE